MRLDIRTKTTLWLVAVLMPVLGAALFAFHHVDERLSEQTEAQLANTLRLEAARISGELDGYERDVASLARDPQVRQFTAAVAAARDGRPVERDDADDMSMVDMSSTSPLRTLAYSMQPKSAALGAEVVDARIVDIHGESLGETSGYSWEPDNTSLLDRAITTRSLQFGDAFQREPGDARLGIIVPIVGPDSRIVGALMVETQLGPIVELVLEHQKFGTSSESFLIQTTGSGDAQFITPLRFDGGAAFNRSVTLSPNASIGASLDAPAGTVIHGADYREVDSILAMETIEPVGWGLVVKVDAAEASAPIDEVRELVVVASLVAIAAMLLAWLTLLNPLSRRLASTARAARRVAGGDYLTPIGDRSRDEIGELGRSIDQLAQDLDADIKMRSGAERQLIVQATHDALTGLFNRSFAQDRVAELCASSNVAEFSLLFLDLDGFKTVNDSFGHPVGDEVLQQVARRLESLVDDTTTVARWGGDEFVLVLPATDATDAAALAVRVEDLFSEPLTSSVGRHSVRCSVGRSTFSSTAGLSAEEVLHDADAEMFRKKQASKGLSVVSSATLRRVERALDEDRIEIWYQPVVDFAGGSERLGGVEALVRLRCVDGSLVPPSEFLPAIHDNHLGAALDDVVLQRSLADVGTWLEQGLVDDDFVLAVNMTGASSRDASYPERVATMLCEAKVDAGSLVLEISEQTNTIDAHVVEQLRRLGVQIALDDLGVQNSNLDRLNDLDPDIIKIDRRWTTDPGAEADAAMMSSLVLMSTQNGATCIAEGIESAEQLAALRSLGLTQFQGYLFGRPQPATDFVAHMLDNRPPALVTR